MEGDAAVVIPKIPARRFDVAGEAPDNEIEMAQGHATTQGVPYRSIHDHDWVLRLIESDGNAS